MKILIIGQPVNFEEFKNKFLGHDYIFSQDHSGVESTLGDQDIIFDFIIDQQPQWFGVYAATPLTVFINTCNISLGYLAKSVNHKLKCTVFGFNGLPTMLNRNILEVSVLGPDATAVLENSCNKLKTEYSIVDDRVGLVTPRVIAMIINEAYYTVQEGTASREDIDLAMKLGTNYPHGPFEWCEKIGIAHIYDLLNAIYEDTKDERYKICPLLKKEYLKAGGYKQ